MNDTTFTNDPAFVKACGNAVERMGRLLEQELTANPDANAEQRMAAIIETIVEATANAGCTANIVVFQAVFASCIYAMSVGAERRNNDLLCAANDAIHTLWQIVHPGSTPPPEASIN